MDRPILASALALALSAGGGRAEEPRFIPFPTAWEEPVGAPADLSFLTAGARVVNTGSRWNEAGTGLVEWGGAPTLVEPVRGRVVLRGLDAAARVEATALDPGGWLAAMTWPAVRTDGGWQIELGREPTVWYVVDVARERGTAPAPPPPDTAPSDPLPAPRLVLDTQHSTPVLTTRSPGAEDVRWGFEGGRVVKVSDTYHLFTSEMVDDPMWVKMRLGHWTSPDRLTWSREGAVRESSGEFEGQDPRASLWSPLPIWDETEDRWNLFHVAYHSAPGDGTEFRLNHEGRIVRLVSETPGSEGIRGPWKDRGVVMKPGPDSLPWEGLQGTDSFFAWPVGDGWRAFYGSARSEVMPIEHWLVGPAEAPSLGGPWRRVAEDNPSPIEERFIENPIVTPAPEGGWLVVYDSEGEGTIGWSHSDDGIHFGPGQRLVIQPEPGVWAKDVRTAMGLVPEGNGRFTLFYTGFEQMPDWDRLLLGKGQETCAIGFVELRLERP